MKPAQARIPNYRVSIHALKRRIVTRYAKNCLLLSLVYDRRCENRCASYSDTYFYHILTPIPAWRDTYAVCQDASSPGPSASGQRHCIKSSLTRIYSAAAVLLARQLLMKEGVVLDALQVNLLLLLINLI
jgi:hypothetical protein